MLSEFSTEFLFILCVLSVWRVTHIFVAEDGIGDFVVKLRVKAGDTLWGQLMDCFYCMSVWIAAPFALLITQYPIDFVICWFALSGAASLLEQWTSLSGRGDQE